MLSLGGVGGVGKDEKGKTRKEKANTWVQSAHVLTDWEKGISYWH